ncbi:MAG: gliding motility-associated C-terminal domain-containing protein, partial [Flavobacterium sp.]
PQGDPVVATSTDPTPCANCTPNPNCPDCTITELPVNPSLQLFKEGVYVDNDNNGLVNVGDTIVYTFTVVNNGDVPVTNITIADPLVAVIGGPIAVLNPGETDSTTFSAVYTITQADIDAGQVENLATATGSDPQGDPVVATSTDPTPCANCTPNPNCPTCTFTPLTGSPSIGLIKIGTFNDLNNDGFAQAGETITYNFTVTNNGNVTLTNVTITDPLVNVIGGPITLAPGQTNSTTFTAVYTLTQADITNGFVINQATACGLYNSTTVCDDSDFANFNDDNPTVTDIDPIIIIANNDLVQVTCDQNGILGNILSNDTINGIAIQPGQVLMTTTNTNPNITIDINGNIVFINPLADGVYNFDYTICAIGALTNCDTATVTINIDSNTNVITLPETLCNLDDAIDLAESLPNGIPTNGVWIDISGSGALNGTVFNPAGLPLGLVTVRYEVLIGTCTQVFEFEITIDECSVLPCNDLVIYNYVSANNDGANDIFVIENITDTCYTENIVEIYNRWGVKVYEGINYDNNTVAFKGISEGRATFNNSKELPTGTYFYILKYKTDTGNVIEKSGYIYLTR